MTHQYYAPHNCIKRWPGRHVGPKWLVITAWGKRDIKAYLEARRLARAQSRKPLVKRNWFQRLIAAIKRMLGR